ncbi:MAG: nitrous oxide reductase accessory protein NosL [Bacteroidia bacterium]
MKNLLYILILSFFLSCSSNKPQPIKYGSEDCSGCKMTIVDEKFGAELITVKGKVYKFDDVSCMILFLKNENITDADINQKLVIDYSVKNKFIDVTRATYYVGEDVHSPMNGNAAAFANKQDAINFQNGKQGFIMEWSEVYNKLLKK